MTIANLRLIISEISFALWLRLIRTSFLLCCPLTPTLSPPGGEGEAVGVQAVLLQFTHAVRLTPPRANFIFWWLFFDKKLNEHITQSLWHVANL